jgi:Nucleolar protein 12 (25kDa)
MRPICKLIERGRLGERNSWPAKPFAINILGVCKGISLTSPHKMPPPTKKRKLQPSAVEEITFDLAARQEYLTGFHKRKLQRAKQAQDAAEKRARAEKIEERRKVGCACFNYGSQVLKGRLASRRTQGRFGTPCSRSECIATTSYRIGHISG